MNHFKSKFNDNPEKRKMQASRVLEILKERFGDDLYGNFVVVGDFNDVPEAERLKPLLSANLENVVQARITDPEERWTYEHNGKTSQIDYLLLSRKISENSSKEGKEGMPFIERRGLGSYVKSYKGPRFEGVGLKAQKHQIIVRLS